MDALWTVVEPVVEELGDVDAEEKSEERVLLASVPIRLAIER